MQDKWKLKFIVFLVILSLAYAASGQAEEIKETQEWKREFQNVESRITGRISELDKANEVLELKVKNLKTGLAQANTLADDFRNQIKTLKVERSELQGKLLDLDKAWQLANTRVESLEADLEALNQAKTKELLALGEINAKLETTILKREAATKYIQDKLTQVSSEKNKLKKQVVKFDAVRAKLESE
ncbi:MAG: hypothetical protein ABIE75_02815, partial [Candidatus Omnitrophota bacterium]